MAGAPRRAPERARPDASHSYRGSGMPNRSICGKESLVSRLQFPLASRLDPDRSSVEAVARGASQEGCGGEETLLAT